MQILLSGRILHDCAARTAAAPSNSNREIGWTELQGTRPLSRRPQHFEALASIPVKVAERVANYKCANKTRDLSCTAGVRNGSKADIRTKWLSYRLASVLSWRMPVCPGTGSGGVMRRHVTVTKWRKWKTPRFDSPSGVERH